jgi:hypothetical protein
MPTITETTIGTRKIMLLGPLLVAVIWFAGMAVAAIAVRPDSVVGFGHL